MDAPIRTFLDSGVLITAYKGLPPGLAAAVNLLNEPHRLFLSSPLVRLEVSPKALYNHRQKEYRFYQTYFRRAVFCDDLKSILNQARRESARPGINAMDSLHIAAAYLLKADEFVTTEKPGKSIYRTSLVNV